MRAPFERIEPTGPETPVIVEVPHAGLELPAPYLEPLAAPARSIARDADLYVDSLYADAAAMGASMLVARASRYVIDLNRSEVDVDAEVVEGARPDVRLHHGLVWRTTSDGERALSRRLSLAELHERLESVWRPYHRALAALVEEKRHRFGLAVILAAHSMPSCERPPQRPAGNGGPSAASAGDREHRQDKQERNGEHGPGLLGAFGKRADVVPGSRGRRSAAAPFIDAIETHARRQGWSVRHDDPYAGGYTTQHYGRPADSVHAVQVELARRLYLDESTLRPLPTFDVVRAWCRGLVGALGDLARPG
jgi:N-formylglutamate amidohydrolase